MANALLGNKAGRPMRLPVLFLCLAGTVVGCSDQASSSGKKVPSGAGQAAIGNPEKSVEDQGFLTGGDALWDTPALPAPTGMTIAGVEVPTMIVEGFLASPWADFCATQPSDTALEAMTTSFYADGQQIFGELVRGVLLLREAESQFPQLATDEVDHFQHQMQLAAGQSVFDAMERHYGPEGVRAHVERRLRLVKLEAEFAKYAPEVTEEELYDLYDHEVLAKLPPSAAERENIDVSFDAMAPKLRGPLQQKKTRLEMERWIDEHIGGVEVTVDLADGKQLHWTEPTPATAVEADGE